MGRKSSQRLGCRGKEMMLSKTRQQRPFIIYWLHKGKQTHKDRKSIKYIGHRYRLHLPPGESYNVLRPEWVEWESELPYNKSRVNTLYNGSLSLFQVRYGPSDYLQGNDLKLPLCYFCDSVIPAVI